MIYHAFAWQALADEPHVILLECTVHFDVKNLGIFERQYDIKHLNFSPVEFGIPSSRPRKHMLLMHRTKTNPVVQFDRPSFMGMFSAALEMDAAKYLTVDEDERYFRTVDPLRVRRGLPELDCKGRRWRLEAVLAPGMQSARDGYRKLAKHSLKSDGWVNLRQSCGLRS